MLEILSINPPLPCQREFVMLESFTVTMVLRYPFSIKELQPQVWTNVIRKKNPSGKWHSINMSLLKTESDGKTHHFRATCILTGQGSYEFTARIGLKEIEEIDEGGKGKSEDEVSEENSKDDDLESSEDGIAAWKWASGWGNNGRIIVHPPNDKMPWTKGPQYVEIHPNVYVGNYIAASHAVELGFKAVLNMSSELDDFYPEAEDIKYKKLGVADGAHNPIPPSFIEEAVQWIHENTLEGNKVLIHCRAGKGRSGSIGIAYMFYLNKSSSFKDTLKTIWKNKPDIYPHKDLDTILEKLFPREEQDANVDPALAPELRKSEALVPIV